VGISATFAVVLSLLAASFGSSALAAPSVELTPVVRGAPPLPGSDVVVLCPDITEKTGVFLARGEDSIASKLARSGYRVFLADPWAAPATASGGFDTVAGEVFPAILQELESRAGGGKLFWLGHGLCGFVPVASAARLTKDTATVHWIALATRLDWTRPSSPLLRWLETWSRGETPVPEANGRLLFTGVRDAVGPRASSVPNGLKPTVSGGAKNDLESYHRNNLLRPPVDAVLDDVMRWFQGGRADASTGWLDYSVGFDKVPGKGLVLLGASDPLAPPENSIHAANRIRPKQKVTLTILARGEGMREDYGHLGVLLSQNASADVDPIILRWIGNGGSGE